MQSQNQFKQSVEKGQLDMRINPNTIPCQVAAGETLLPGMAVKLVDDSNPIPVVTPVTADTDKVFGVVPYNLQRSSHVGDDGDVLEISIDGSIIYMEASAAIARGADVMVVVASEKVALSTSGKAVLGFAFDKAAADGDLIRVYVQGLQGKVTA